ncbi:MAG: hypothetical protein A2784_03310 [Candidatus Chisholmbacteria bacterium RIFCSPHIGHO2_01_FULL_48_12]|uniref:Ribbon-helix-helix protein CopG domain-containing protein n=1 Tax=Candidatus Chisholmbacteria bacterium RIFCSPHIGHO2_01_FULL_48_12 TaxID=1797589 RepID=A0A1G1VPU2_9BACT|nr:MAG: hypothetical protein A2784_03310 [Candidatus Chisholmbacteria bacterium RIFCSPHIGHO2_01_FULL_48_12]
MLTHRTNVLLTEEDNQLLTLLATRYNTTKGDIIRRAFKTTYPLQKKTKTLAQFLRQGWKLLKKPHQPLNYKALIAYGRH